MIVVKIYKAPKDRKTSELQKTDLKKKIQQGFGNTTPVTEFISASCLYIFFPSGIGKPLIYVNQKSSYRSR